MATFIEICQAVRAQAGISGTGPSSVISQVGINADVVRWVEESYNEIQSTFENWKFLYKYETFTQLAWAQESIPSVTDNVRILSKDSLLIEDAQGVKSRLKFIDFVKFKNTKLWLLPDTGQPTVVTQLPNGILHFFPIPDKDYTIHMESYSRPDVMTVNEDVPIMHTQYHDLIKLLALTKYAEYYSEGTIMNSARDNYDKLLYTMKSSELPSDSIILRAFV